MDFIFDFSIDSSSINSSRELSLLLNYVDKYNGILIRDSIEGDYQKNSKFKRIISILFDSSKKNNIIMFFKKTKNLQKVIIEAIYSDGGNTSLIYSSTVYKKESLIKKKSLLKLNEVETYLRSNILE